MCHQTCPYPLFGENSTQMCEVSCKKPNTYIDVLFRICLSCHASCSSCSGPSMMECKSCYTDYQLVGSYCRYTKCVSPQYFLITNEIENFSVGTCINYCPSPLVGLPESQICFASCQKINQYIDPLTRECKDCHSSCLRCNGNSSTNCTECDNSCIFSPSSNSCTPRCAIPLFYDPSI